jgi:hypothetical protein
VDSRLDEDTWFMLLFFLLSRIVALVVCSSPPLFLSNQSLSIYINTNGNSFYLIPRNRDRDRESV